MTQNSNRTGSDLPGALPGTGFETVDLGAVSGQVGSASTEQFHTASTGTSQTYAMGDQARPTVGATADKATQATSDVVDQAKQTVGAAAGQAKQATGEVVDQAKQQATSLVAAQKDRAATGLGDVAQALRHTSEQLQGPEQALIHQYVDKAADRVEHFSDYLRGRDVRDIVSEVEQYARRQPVLFLGGAFVLGLVGARFLKSTSQPTSTSGGYQPSPRLPDYRPPSGGSLGTPSTSYTAGLNRPSSTTYGSTSVERSTGSTGSTGSLGGIGSLGTTGGLGGTSSLGGTGSLGTTGGLGGTSSLGGTGSLGGTSSMGSTGSMEDR